MYDDLPDFIKENDYPKIKYKKGILKINNKYKIVYSYGGYDLAWDSLKFRDTEKQAVKDAQKWIKDNMYIKVNANI